MITVNKRIAVTPFESTSVELETRRGMTLVKQKQALTPLTVVFRSEESDYEPGDVVFVRGDACKLEYARQIFTIEGISFILIPYSDAVLLKRKPHVSMSVPADPEPLV